MIINEPIHDQAIGDGEQTNRKCRTMEIHPPSLVFYQTGDGLRIGRKNIDKPVAYTAPGTT